MEVLSAKCKTRIGFWNVRTMYETGKLTQITAEMRRHKLHILGVSESRWTGSGRVKTQTGETVLYSGREDNQHHQGVAIILRKGTEKCLIEWKPINSRLITARVRGRHGNMTLIQCYAPTNDGDDEAKDTFYDQLQAEVSAAPRHDLLIVMGDMNAKVGNDNTHVERAMGRHGCGCMNENGERLVELCTTYNLVIGGTLFPHRNVHKLTWCSPNGRDSNQIDHLMINGTWRRSLLDVRVRRGADVGSDHHLVVADIKMKLRSTRHKSTAHRRFDVGRLQDPKLKNAFILQVKNRFQALADMTDTCEADTEGINQRWDLVRTVYQKSSETSLGLRETKKKEWITPETWKAIEERRDLKKKVASTRSERLQEKFKLQYREMNQKVKRSARTDKRAYLNNLASEAEEAARKGEQGKLYKITKTISGKFHSNNNAPVKDKEGKLLTTEREQEARWAEHFREVLNRPPPSEEADIQEAIEDLDVNIAPPEKQEIITAIKSLKNRKAPGQDNLNAELFKADPELATNILQPLFTAVWEGKQVPDDWTRGVIVKIPKKGSLSDCNNWRGITLLSIPSKIMTKIIIQRISEAVDAQLREEQAGFRRGRGCTDHIFALRNIIEQCTEWQRQLYINFVDFQKAFDSIHRESLWRILRAYGIPMEIVLLIKSFYANFSCCVGNSDIYFEVGTGVRQGCVMSSLLFNLVIDWVMRHTTEDEPRGIRWTLSTNLEDLDFADDLALLSHTHRHMQEKTTHLNTFAQQVGLHISRTKTEVMTLNTTNTTPISIEGEDLPMVESFTYLGSMVKQDGGAGRDIQSRLSKDRGIFCSLSNIWKTTQYSIRIKLRLYQSLVLSTLLYGSECWRMTDSDLNKLSVFHTKSLRRILGIFWPRTISNEELLAQCGQESMTTILMKKRWRWIGHVIRGRSNSITKTALHWTPEGKRKRGRPKNTWRRTVEAEMKTLNHSWGTVGKLTQDRQKWRTFVAALRADRHNGH
ncbi:hypothetical protein NFI96_005381 [Prochilodus magdalenae]|nr:hypothetical protein NFI96_005381 [Prochilodus magdalenae]